MAECFICKYALSGSWNVTTCGTSYEKTGRYLGITDGYFLYQEYPNWVYVYCKSCWQNEILKLSFVQARISQSVNASQNKSDNDPIKCDTDHHLEQL